MSVELEGLPCRPCDQRVCVPGDFRCLTTLMPDMVIRAAEQALAAAMTASYEPDESRRRAGADAFASLPAAPLERAACLALLAFAAALQVSIAAADILLTIADVLWLAVVIRNRERIERAADVLAARRLRRPRRSSRRSSRSTRASAWSTRSSSSCWSSCRSSIGCSAADGRCSRST